MNSTHTNKQTKRQTRKQLRQARDARWAVAVREGRVVSTLDNMTKQEFKTASEAEAFAAEDPSSFYVVRARQL